MIIFQSTYQIGNVRLSVSSNLTKINTLKTRGVVYISAPDEGISKVYSLEIERRRFPMQR